MATVSLIQMLASGVVHPTTGAILASGVVRFYQPSTMTPQTVYSDNAGATPISQPLILTAGGTGIAYTLTPVRMIVETADDITTLYDVNINTGVDDSIFVTSPSFNGGVQTQLSTILDAVSTSFGGTAGYWKYKIGTTERNIKDAISSLGISVLDYGAVGDDATDNTTAIQNTINAVVAAGGGTVLFPPGIFRISSALSNNASTSPLKLLGAGPTASTIKQTGGAANGFTNGGSSIFTVEGLTMSATASSGTGIALPATTQTILLTNVKVSGFNGGISGVGTSGIGNSIVLLNVIVDVQAASAGACLSGSFDNTTIVGGSLNGTVQSFNCTNMLFTATQLTSVSSCTIVGMLNYNGLFSMDLPSTCTLGAIALVGGSVQTGPIRINASSTARLILSACNVAAAINDARTTGAVALSLSVSAPASPQFNIPMRIIQATPGTTVTINSPIGTGFLAGAQVEVACINNSGGAVTWTFAAGYKTSGAVAPATGNVTIVKFTHDHLSGVLRESTRATAAI